MTEQEKIKQLQRKKEVLETKLQWLEQDREYLLTELSEVNNTLDELGIDTF